MREETMNAKTATLLAALAAAVSPLLPQQAAAQSTHELKLSTFQPLNNHYTEWLQGWANTLKERSGGRLNPTIYPSGQLGAMPRQYDLARTGVADVAVAMHGGTPGRFPLSELSHIPFIVPNAAVGSEALTALVPDYLGEEHRGVRVLALTTGTPLALLTNKVAVRKPADLKGLRIRHPDAIAAATLSALGAVPVYTETGQIADALSKGTIDGALLAWEALESFQVTTQFATDWGANVTTFAVVMSPATYDGLDADLKKVIDDTTGPAAARLIGKMSDDAAIHGKAWARKNGTEVIELAAAERAAFDEASKDVVADLIAGKQKKGLKAEQMIAAYKAKMAALHGSAK
jgi:TRAP-type C4-dicarboxylate transport system substrate-binding protein